MNWGRNTFWRQQNDRLGKTQLRLMIQGGRRQGEASSKPESIQIQKTPLQCWGYGDLHYYKNCPHRTHAETTTHTQEASTVGDVARIIQNINVALDDHQVKYQSAMVEFEGKIVDHSISILIDPGESLIYISPKIVDLGRLLVAKFSSPWLVQLATWTKRRVTAKVNDRLIEIMGIRVKVNLNIYPLG